MTPIVLFAQAERELDEIKAYFSQFGESTARNILDDIKNTLKVVSILPEGGLYIGKGLRRQTSIRYRFVVTYRILDDYVEIMSIYRYQNRPTK